MSFSNRLHAAIPGGCHTYSRGDDQFPSNAPPILSHGKGAYVWDTSGNKFIDYGMGLRSVTLGYADQRVNESAVTEINKGNSLTRASVTELLAAEVLIDLIPSIEMVKFAKNGSNVTTAAIKVARAYTSRNYICIPRQHPFFSFDDWFINTTPVRRGIPASASDHILLFDYNDIKSLEQHFSDYPGHIAAVMLEPSTHVVPSPYNDSELTSVCPLPPQEGHFLSRVRSLCTTHGALLILDEMITGFRWNPAGAQYYFSVEPDLCTFGKGISNGFSLAALAGKKEFMQVGSILDDGSERTFLLSSTHGAEMASLGAFMRTAKIMVSEQTCSYLWSYGQRFKDAVNSVVSSHGLSDYIKFEGPAIQPIYLTNDQNHRPSLPFRTLFAQELLKSGVMMPWISFSACHTDVELDMTVQAVDSSCSVYKSALRNGIQHYLESPVIKPVFRARN